jgi:hypothetical protein
MVHYTANRSLALDHLLVVENRTQVNSPCIFSLDCIIKIRPFSIPKMTSVGPEPQWYITQPVVFNTRPLARS